MNQNEHKVIGYFLQNKDNTFSQLLDDTGMNIHAADEAMKSLLDAGIIKGRGYAAHIECYYVVGGRQFIAKLGKAFIESQ